MPSRFLSRASVAASCLTVGCCLSACSTGTNSIEIRMQEAALVPQGVHELAPQVAVPIYPFHSGHTETSFTFQVESGATGTLLPNAEMLTAAHALSDQFDPSKNSAPRTVTMQDVQYSFTVIYPWLVSNNLQFAEIIAFEKTEKINGDWALLKFTRSKEPILPPQPGSPAARLIRFDGRATIGKGSTLYCLGFPRTPDEKPIDITNLARALTVVQGAAIRDFGPDEEVIAISETRLDMRGMSGGPVGTYNFLTGEFTVVGTVTRGSPGFTILGRLIFQPYFVTSRLAPIVMERLAAPAAESTSPTPLPVSIK